MTGASCFSIISLYGRFLRRSITAAGLSSQTVEIDGDTTIHFWGPPRAATSKPQLVLIHGFGPQSIWQWRQQISFFARDFDVYVPDLVFFGDSFTKSPERSEVFQATCVAKLLEKLGIRCSGDEWAAMWPERVEKVVIASSAVNMRPGDNDSLLKKANVENIEDLMMPVSAGQLRKLLGLVVFRRPYIPDFVLNDLIDKLYSENRKEKLELLKGLRTVTGSYSHHTSPFTAILLPNTAPLLHSWFKSRYLDLASRQRHNPADSEENEQTAEIDRRIEQETKAEKHIQKLLLLGMCSLKMVIDSGTIKLLFQSGFDEAELKGYIPVIHANVYQTIKILHDGSKELSLSLADPSKFMISDENKETYSRGNELQVPDCAHYFMENLQRLSDADYVPTKEDVLYARVRTTGVVEIQFSPVGENKKSGEVYRLFDVGGQKNERRKWIHLFEGVTAVIFCAAISEYDQTLFEDDNKNRMMETKELFEWVLKQPCFEKTSFMLFLNKFDLFEKKVLKVPLNVCAWFKDYQPVSTGKQEIEHAYEFVKKKFEELYFQSTGPDRVDRVFKIYRTTALDQKLVKKTFKLVDETLRRRNLFEAGLL
ncbi:UNVERIFIED_CONTAM: Guanine nucleotide-binding protein alpha-1 subunit [Sesamum calycinum]|uniref:Guanine nucleotide-binding protein alpha subunit n=1 Tax=Sesamum calycinum TaxID=2727403 RepID=A0AAW2LX17_9LAMI